MIWKLAWSIGDPTGRFRRGCGTIIRMRQLQLFTTAELAKMRDRTKARNYSPERDEFRREHERRRAFGLARRHAQRMYNSFQRAASACEKDREGPTSRTSEPIASERAARAALNWRSQTNPDRSRRQPKRNDQPASNSASWSCPCRANIGPQPTRTSRLHLGSCWAYHLRS